MQLFAQRPDRDVLADYRAQRGGRQRVLASASGPRVELLAFTDHFAVRFADQPWQQVGWHEVYTGGWRAEAQEIHWRLVDGRREAYQLDDERNFPQVFRERVQATVALDEAFDAPGRGQVRISARRDLSDGASGLIWHVRGTGGADLGDPETRALAERLEHALRADYDF